MRLILNGEGIETASETVQQLLQDMGIEPERVAVEVNLKVLKRAEFQDYQLHEDDAVEIVYFVGGGTRG
ncbi:MAG: sulfur carrier protein ThiS [Nitrospirae bacterium]|nr:sulfur carrier protein ThiS [Nitrospirota bacterium]